MSWLLAIDCSDRACSVALGNGAVVNEEFTDEPRQHAQQVLPMMRKLLAEAGVSKTSLDAIAVAVGPGSFTGLRIALSTAQAMAYALDKPIITLSSLESLACRSSQFQINEGDDTSLFVGLDARMGEVYCASFDINGGVIQRQTEDMLLGQSEAYKLAQACDYGLGGALKLEGIAALEFRAANSDEQIHASDVFQLALARFERGETNTATAIEPAYLRREQAWKKLGQQGQGTGLGQ